MFAAATAAGEKDNQKDPATKLDYAKFMALNKEAGIDLTKMESPEKDKNLADYFNDKKGNAVIPPAALVAILKGWGLESLISKDAFSYEKDGKKRVLEGDEGMLKQIAQVARNKLSKPNCTCSDAKALSDYLNQEKK